VAISKGTLQKQILHAPLSRTEWAATAKNHIIIGLSAHFILALRSRPRLADRRMLQLRLLACFYFSDTLLSLDLLFGGCLIKEEACSVSPEGPLGW
jgi:hypothetical protein